MHACTQRVARQAGRHAWGLIYRCSKVGVPHPLAVKHHALQCTTAPLRVPTKSQQVRPAPQRRVSTQVSHSFLARQGAGQFAM